MYSSQGAFVLVNDSTATDDTAFASADGFYVEPGSKLTNSRSYDNSGDGVLLNNDGSAALISGDTIYGNATGIGGDLRNYGYSAIISGAATIENNLIYGNTAAAIDFNSGTNVTIDNNTIAQTGAPAVAVVGYATDEAIENNVFVVSGGPAVSVDASSESGIDSDYNLFDLGTGGTVGSFAGLGYATLAAWYYAVGEDQHSEVGDPDLIDPAGPDGVEGFETVSATGTVVDNGGPGFAVNGATTTLSSGVNGSALVIATGSSTVATWSFTGLVAGETYQLAATWPGNTQSYGYADYIATDAQGHVLAGNSLGQGNSPSSSGFALSNNYALIGTFVATGSTITVSLTGSPSGPVIADAVSLTPVGVDHSADDDFQVAAGSSTIDAGDPSSVAVAEPAPNGGRVNQGYQGATASTPVSPEEPEVQVLTPSSLDKLQVGEQADIDFRTYDVAAEQPVLLVHAGGAAITTAEQGDWQGDAYRLNGNTYVNYGTVTGVPASLPASLFQTGAYANSGAGNELSFLLPVADGTYTLRLFFADNSAYAVNQRVFDIVGNGVTLVSKYDPFAATGVENQATELDVTVTVTGGKGLALNLVNDSSTGGYLPAFVNGVELDHVVAGGAVSPTANIEVSTDNGATWSLIASDVTVNRFGLGQYVWTVDRTSAGNTAMIRVISGGASGESGDFLLANASTSYYINDSSTLGDQYTTAVGNDANSGTSPNQPLATLGELLRAYPLTAGDTVYIDTGSYTLPTDLTLGASDSGTGTSAAARVLITGPTNGGVATLDRANLDTYTAAFHITASDLTLANLVIADASTVLDIAGGTGLTLQNDTVQGSTGQGIDVEGSKNVGNLLITGSTLQNNAEDGLYFEGGNGSVSLVNDQVIDNAIYGVDLESAGATATGLVVHGNGATYDYPGIQAPESDTVITDSTIYGNSGDGIDLRGTITDSLVYSNARYGIYDSGATGAVNDDTIYGQTSSNYYGLWLNYGATGTGDVIYGNAQGVFVGDDASALLNSRVYDNTGDGIDLGGGGYSGNTSLIGNIVYSNAIGIDLHAIVNPPYGTTISDNLIYANTSIGLEIIGEYKTLVASNTIDQSVGEAIAVSGGAENVHLVDNILEVDEGTILTIASDSETGFNGSYNLYYLGPQSAATLGSYGGSTAATLSAWQMLTGQDVTGSLSGNPDFVNPAGADDVLGGPTTAQGGGLDDNFGLQPGSAAIDSGTSYGGVPVDDLAGRARHDDPATPNTGTGYDNFTETNAGASSVTAGNTVLWANGSQLSVSYMLPFAFTFYGTAYTSVTVSAQGFLQFAGPDAAYYQTPSAAGLESDVRIAPFWTNSFYSSATVSTTANSVTFTWTSPAGYQTSGINVSVTLFSQWHVPLRLRRGQ